jgi:hypothetical protein
VIGAECLGTTHSALHDALVTLNDACSGCDAGSGLFSKMHFQNKFYTGDICKEKACGSGIGSQHQAKKYAKKFGSKDAYKYNIVIDM